SGEGAIHAGDVAGVFGGAAKDGFFVKGIGRVGEGGRHISSLFPRMEMRVEDHLRAPARGPADGFGVAPSLVADRDAECQGAGLENASSGAEGIGGFFGRV